jgi:TPR repeat protein
MKLWQVQGKDLRELKREALNDAQRLEDWLVAAAAKTDEHNWVVVNRDDGESANIKTARKVASPPANTVVVQEIRSLAEKGDATAQAALGFFCELGIHTPVDCAQAVKWYRKAAEQGNARAQLNLRQIAEFGFTYEKGNGRPAESSEVIKKCRKDAEAGNARSQFNLGQMYEWGNEVTQDFAEAVKWYRLAAEQGGAAAQFMLGVCYCNGQGVRQSTDQAVKWWRQSAQQGEAEAQFKLGLCYCNGQGVPQDYAEAVKWYREAAEQGETTAQAKLGDAYYIGLGVTANYTEAVKWYREAADHGQAGAQRHLGIMYGLGQGVPQDFIQAFKWYTLAAAQNDSNAIHNRDILSASMTASQIAEAQRLSIEFVARTQNGVVNGDNHHGAVIAEPHVTEQPQTARATRCNALFGIDFLLVGRQVATASGGTIDLLAIDAEANLVVLVLKRDKPPHELLAQTLDYASWVNSLSYNQVDEMTKGFTGQPLGRAFSNHFGAALPERVNARHSMLVLTSELDASSERIVRYLAHQHKVPIQVILIALFKTTSGEFIGQVRR